MPKYFYVAKSLKGEEKSGTLEAKDEHQLARNLRQEGYLLISVFPEEKEIKKRKLEFSISKIFGIPLSEKLFFTRNLRVIIGAGISLPRALRTLANQTRNKRFKKTLSEIEDRVVKGESFSDSLAKHPRVFSELFCSMVRVGEEAGTLEDVLKLLSQQMEKEYELQAKIKGAMIYPAVIILAMLGIGIMMLIMVVPKLAETFEELQISLPPTTRLVIGLGNFLANFWYTLPLIIIFLFFLLKLVLKTAIGKRAVGTLSLKIPILSSLIKKTNSARTVRTLGSLIASGVPIVRSLEIVASTFSNVFYKKAILEAAEKVKKGEKLSDALKPYENIYPLMVIQMIEVGEETGETSGILMKLADFFEEEVSNATKNLTSVIEPVLMIIIGGAIGFFAISMVQPMYSMLGAIK